MASTFQKQAASPFTAPFQSRQVLVGVVDSGQRKVVMSGSSSDCGCHQRTTNSPSTRDFEPQTHGTWHYLTASGMCNLHRSARRSPAQVVERRFARPHGHSLLGHRSAAKIFGVGGTVCWAEEIPAADRPRASGAHDSRDGPGVLTQDEGRMALAKRNWLATATITMTERRRPDRSRGHEVEQPDHRRLDMPESERRRQGPGEAWPPPEARDRFEMPSTRGCS